MHDPIINKYFDRLAKSLSPILRINHSQFILYPETEEHHGCIGLKSYAKVKAGDLDGVIDITLKLTLPEGGLEGEIIVQNESLHELIAKMEYIKTTDDLEAYNSFHDIVKKDKVDGQLCKKINDKTT